MLTRKQYKLLMFIHNKLQEDGVSPSYDEMKDYLELKSKSGIHRLITSLEDRGYLRRLPNRARALEVIKLPENIPYEDRPLRHKTVYTDTRQPMNSTHDTNRSEIGDNEIGRNETAAAVTRNPFAANNTLRLQLYGKIAAGTPIEALRDNTSFIDVPIAMLGKGNHYALQIDGESMIEAGILDGDTIILRQTDRANNGDVIVALVDNEEATLKYFHQDYDDIILEPANRNYQAKRYRPEQIRIQGCLIGLLRQY